MQYAKRSGPSLLSYGLISVGSNTLTPGAMMYALNAHTPDKLLDVAADLANFLLIRGPFAWLGPLVYSTFRRKPR